MEAHQETGGYGNSIRTTARFVLWALAWLVTLAVARFGPGLMWDSQQSLASWVAVAANLLVGIGWVVAFTHLLQAMDELQRKILQDALAVNSSPTTSIIAVLPALLGVVYVIAFAVGKFRYR